MSDNASTDNTEIICREFEKQDPRVSYYRQPTNVGGIKNFVRLLNETRTDFFVFLAGDDYWESDYLSANIENLRNNKSAIASISRVSFEENGEFCHESSGTEPITGDRIKRLKNIYRTQ
jgi:glycosyltransferase involved in cell wall biosynthesis